MGDAFDIRGGMGEAQPLEQPEAVAVGGGELARLHQLGVYGEANALKSLRGESKGRHYRG